MHDLSKPLLRAAAFVRPLADESLGGARSEFVSFRGNVHGSRMEPQLLRCRRAEWLAGILLDIDPDPSPAPRHVRVAALPAGSGSMYRPIGKTASLERRPHELARSKAQELPTWGRCILRRFEPALHDRHATPPMRAHGATEPPAAKRELRVGAGAVGIDRGFAAEIRPRRSVPAFRGAMFPRLGCQSEIGGILLCRATVRNIRHLYDGGNQWRGASGR
jgi:hypothetical protein